MKLKTRSALDAQGAPASRDAMVDTAVRPPSPLVLIDDALLQFVSRHLVTGTEVVDLLLDVRTAIELDRSFAVLADPSDIR